MNSFWSFATKALLVVVLLQAWFLYDLFRKNTALTAVNTEYSATLKDSEEKISQLQNQLAETEKKTVDGILKETNKAVVQGWENLLDKVEQELEKARDAVPELLELELEPDTTTPDASMPDEAEPAKPEDHSASGDSMKEPVSPSSPPILIPGERT